MTSSAAVPPNIVFCNSSKSEKCCKNSLRKIAVLRSKVSSSAHLSSLSFFNSLDLLANVSYKQSAGYNVSTHSSTLELELFGKRSIKSNLGFFFVSTKYNSTLHDGLETDV